MSNKWSGKRDSNSRPQPWQGCALPTELFPPNAFSLKRGAKIVLLLLPTNYLDKKLRLALHFFIPLLLGCAGTAPYETGAWGMGTALAVTLDAYGEKRETVAATEKTNRSAARRNAVTVTRPSERNLSGHKSRTGPPCFLKRTAPHVSSPYMAINTYGVMRLEFHGRGFYAPEVSPF